MLLVLSKLEIGSGRKGIYSLCVDAYRTADE